MDRRRKGKPKMTFIKQACKDVSMQIYLELKRQREINTNGGKLSECFMNSQLAETWPQKIEVEETTSY